MMRMRFFLILLLLVAEPVHSPAQHRVKQPRLVVGIVVDQMRYEYLQRYWNRFGEGGFKKLVSGGYSCRNTHYNYIPTYTGPGHAAIYTGTTPSQNGIIANEWFDIRSGKSMYCASDTFVRPLGGSRRSGGSRKSGCMSPRNMLVKSMGDQLKEANPQSKIIGIALKDRGAIFPAGKAPDAAYWADGPTDKWMSSSYYMTALPGWVQSFNEAHPPASYLNRSWTTLYPIETYTASTADDVPWEGTFPKEKKPVFPHDSLKEIRKTPFGNTYTADFAMEAIVQEQLGLDEITDLLTVSFSSSDYVGHMYGPHAIETEDMFLRLDKDLERFLHFIDSVVGLHRTLVFLTSDHGAADNPDYLKANKMSDAGFFDSKLAKRELIKMMEKKYGKGKWIRFLNNQQVYFNNELMAEKKLDRERIKRECIEILMKQPGVKSVVDFDQRLIKFTHNATSEENQMLMNGYHPGRSGDLYIYLLPNWIDHGRKGTTHGSCYSYDTHVPLIWYGWKIKKGSLDDRVPVTSIANTVLMLLSPQPIIDPKTTIPVPLEE